MRAASTPAVSIMTISKDDPEGLSATVASVKAQAHDDYELLVVRSGSSQALPLPTDDPRLIVLDEPARGISRAFNTGIARGRGEWVQFLNRGDAFLEPESLRHLADARRDDVEVVLSFASVKGRGTTIPRDPLGQGSYGFLYASHQASLFRTRLFQAHGEFSPRFRIRMAPATAETPFTVRWRGGAALPPDEARLACRQAMNGRCLRAGPAIQVDGAFSSRTRSLCL